MHVTLQSLQYIATNETAGLARPKLPLLRNSKARKELEAVILCYTDHSGGSRAGCIPVVLIPLTTEDCTGAGS